MLSKTEIEFLKSPEKFDSEYKRVLKCRVKAKSTQLRETLLLLQGNGLNITENCNSITEYSNANLSTNQAEISKRMAGPRGFEPLTSGSAGRCPNPY
jgi:hypothetical protein